MKKNYTYAWSSVNLNTNCSACGNNIVFQEFDGRPTCNECGNINEITWLTILKRVDVVVLAQGDQNKKRIMGDIDASILLKPIEKINCYHCKSALEIHEEDDIKSYACKSCNESLYFKEYKELSDMVFYKNAATISSQENVKLIAVRCVSCGAPLEVDSTKSNFHCQFCSTDNVLPMSLRYKVVLADMFVGARKSKFTKDLAFGQDENIIIQTLTENGKGSFTDDELYKILIGNINNLDIYNLVKNKHQYKPPSGKGIVNKIFNTSTNPAIIKMAGHRLDRSKAQIEKRINEVTPKLKETEAKVADKKPNGEDDKKQASDKNPGFFKRLFG